MSQRNRRSWLGPDPRTEVIDIASGNVIHQVTTTPPIFADEIWYNPGDERVYFGSFVNTPGKRAASLQRDRHVALDRRVSDRVSVTQELQTE